MRTRILLLVLCLGFIQNGYGQTQSELLEKAYKENSIGLLKQFFDNWSTEIQPDLNSQNNDTIREIYSVFNAMFKPTRFDLIGGSELSNTTYHKSAYYLVQSSLREIYVVDSLGNSLDDFLHHPPKLEPESCDSIISFHPPIINAERNVIYLTPEYQKLLERFLEGTTMDGHETNECQRRKAFLENMIIIFPHTGVSGPWNLKTFPSLGMIVLDKKLTSAFVYIHLLHEVNGAILKKNGETWEIREARRFLIE